jgi:uncharacterized membrane protein
VYVKLTSVLKSSSLHFVAKIDLIFFTSQDFIQTLFHSLACNLNVEPKGTFTSNFLSQSLKKVIAVCISQITDVEDEITCASSG